MGAASFENTLVGKDLSKAFNEAREQAAWYHGHGGYTGTIAEKDGYVLMTLPPRVSVDRLLDLINKNFEYRYAVEAYREGWSKRKPGKNPVPANLLAFVEKAGGIFDDKWGPALVVEVTGKAAVETKRRMGRAGTRDRVWVAMGMASS